MLWGTVTIPKGGRLCVYTLNPKKKNSNVTKCRTCALRLCPNYALFQALTIKMRESSIIPFRSLSRNGKIPDRGGYGIIDISELLNNLQENIHIDNISNVSKEIILNSKRDVTLREIIIELVFKSDTDHCICWNKFTSCRPQLFIKRRVKRLAREIMERKYGSCLDKEAAHICGNPFCINHKHIYLATPEENRADIKLHRMVTEIL
jgi:hypothetical protein